MEEPKQVEDEKDPPIQDEKQDQESKPEILIKEDLEVGEPAQDVLDQNTDTV